MINETCQTCKVKTYNKKNYSKINIPKNDFLELYVYITTKHSFININFVIFSFHISIEK